MLGASCETRQIPKIETCVVSSSGLMGCDDPRLGADDRSYVRESEVTNYCTNFGDFKIISKFIAEILEENKKLKRRLRRCR